MVFSKELFFEMRGWSLYIFGSSIENHVLCEGRKILGSDYEMQNPSCASALCQFTVGVHLRATCDEESEAATGTPN